MLLNFTGFAGPGTGAVSTGGFGLRGGGDGVRPKPSAAEFCLDATELTPIADKILALEPDKTLVSIWEATGWASATLELARLP